MPSCPDGQDIGVDGLEALVERLHEALAEFFRGNPSPVLPLFSRDDDVTLGNPFGPFVRGFEDVSDRAISAATHYRDGEVVAFERVATYKTDDLAGFVEIERYRVKVDGSHEMSDVALRVTTIARREEDRVWRIASRHADPITVARPAESVIQRHDAE
jgi:ketosteroid isomerase-like protein